MLFSAIGDALGWPTEFLDASGRRKPSFTVPVTDFVQWQKLVGGKWWGYEEVIEPGSYSDDTQLALAVARCINDVGIFETALFAYEELPLWLQYERGGGRTVKTAARNLISRNVDWLHNFYKQGDLNYSNAGANGAAMRNLPITLVNVGNEEQIIKDSFFNAIITHGHPRAIIGAMLFGLATNYVLTMPDAIKPEVMVEYLISEIERAGRAVAGDVSVAKWISAWERENKETTFRSSFHKYRQEAISYLKSIGEHIDTDPKSYYAFIGALSPETKGSGVATVCAAIYLFLKYADQPKDAILASANVFGSDTDTVGTFLGALLGAHNGLKAIPDYLLMRVQDREYLCKTAERLHSIALKKQRGQLAKALSVDRQETYKKILAWETSLSNMFLGKVDETKLVAHPALGSGKIIQRLEKPIQREGYVARLIHVQFDCGQSCIFHSRIEKGNKISESLAKDVLKALK
ncbi:hypothetical protein KSD_03740 [Ktedonobacter sp. SOSP1-85]|nr:hypothetical protein KSD_03740 [Ktedonobacter sp. SOSP1-85]